MSTLALAACGSSDNTDKLATQGTNAATETSNAESAPATTAAPSKGRIELDDGRIAVTALPSGYVQRDVGGSTVSPSGSRVAAYNFIESNGPGSFVIAVHRGGTVVDDLQLEPMKRSDLQTNPPRELYQAQLELLGTRQLAWPIAADAVIWLTSPTLSFDELAALASAVEVVQ